MKIKNLILGIAIFVITLLVVVTGINTFYEKPKYDDFCGEFKTQKVIDSRERCEEIGGKWTEQDIKCITEPCPTGFCDKDFTCREDYDSARKTYYRNVFLIAIPLGVLIIVVGALVFGLEVVGAGLMAGGVGTILYGVGGYWRYTDNWLRFVISLIGLIALIWLAYYFNKEFGKRKF